MDGVVVGELGGSEVEVPIVLERRDVVADGSGDNLVGVFCLAVGLWVVGGGHVELGARGEGEGLPEVGGETGVTVGDELCGPAKMPVDDIIIDLGHSLSIDGGGGGGHEDTFSEAASKADESIMASWGDGEVHDEVHGDRFPRLVGDGKGLQEA